MKEGRVEQARWWQSRPVLWSAASGVILVVGFVLAVAGAPETLVTAVYVVAAVVGARFFAAEAFEQLVHDRQVGIELLMTVGAVAAGALGEWGEAATLAFLYSISEALEAAAEARTERAIEALMDLAPATAVLIEADGSQRTIPAEDLAVGNRFLVRPGGAVPTDGTIVEGQSALNEAAVTGESIPVEKSVGHKVFAGTLNGNGALVIEATATREDNTLARIVHLVSEAQEEKGRAQRFMERFSRVYSPSVLGLGVATALIGGAVTGSWHDWIARAATVIVAAAPCALVISIPVTYVAAIGSAGRRGVLVKGGIVLEDLATVRVAAFDKTGTLTHGTPRLVEIVPGAAQEPDRILAVAAAVEQRSEHPLAQALITAADERGLALPEVTDTTALVGSGIEAALDGAIAVVGSPRLMTERAVNLDQFADAIERLEATGATTVVLAIDNQARGVFGLADTVRANAAASIAALRRAGIDRTVMITGDNERTAQAIGAQVGVDDTLAERRPEDKAAAVHDLLDRYGPTVMAGDGINDAPALATATVGVAMGSAGSDVALDTADVALMADDLSKLVDALTLARRTRTVVRQNLALSFAVLAVLIPGALLGILNLSATVAAHELSELVVIASGLRMARFRPPPEPPTSTST